MRRFECGGEARGSIDEIGDIERLEPPKTIPNRGRALRVGGTCARLGVGLQQSVSRIEHPQSGIGSLEADRRAPFARLLVFLPSGRRDLQHPLDRCRCGETAKGGAKIAERVRLRQRGKSKREKQNCVSNAHAASTSEAYRWFCFATIETAPRRLSSDVRKRTSTQPDGGRRKTNLEGGQKVGRHAAVVARSDIGAKCGGASEALQSLAGTIDDATMRRLDFEVDGKKRSAGGVAREFLAPRRAAP
ncbi:MAG TPA: hypothetical protein VNL91_06660 [Thermoanaerobaculia bacterium]|nr:hypothetical protein [Thermoanaerobaculia bacterium]